jgi:hypothetical protein
MLPDQQQPDATVTPTAPVAPKQPVNWTKIRSALVKAHPNLTKAQLADLDGAIKKRQVKESIALGITSPKDIAATYPDLANEAVAGGTPIAGIQKKDAGIGSSVQDITKKLLERDTAPITGLLQIRSHIPGTQAAYTKDLYDQLKGVLSLENRTYLKGSGQISDYESKLLADAATALNQNLSNEDFKQVLKDLNKRFTKEYGQKEQPINEYKGNGLMDMIKPFLSMGAYGNRNPGGSSMMGFNGAPPQKVGRFQVEVEQ